MRKSFFVLGFFCAASLMQACMKAERLGTDTNSPEGFVLGSLALNPLTGGEVASWETYTVADGLPGSPITAVGMDDMGNVLVAHHVPTSASVTRGRFYRPPGPDIPLILLNFGYQYNALQVAMNGAGQAFVIASSPENIAHDPVSVGWAAGAAVASGGATCGATPCTGLGISAGIDGAGNVLLAHNAGGGAVPRFSTATPSGATALTFQLAGVAFSCGSVPSLVYSPGGKGALACVSDTTPFPLRVASFANSTWTDAWPPALSPPDGLVAVRVAANDRGDVAVAYSSGTTTRAAVRPASGSSWIASVGLCGGTAFDIALDGDGNALMACQDMASKNVVFARYSTLSSNWGSTTTLGTNPPGSASNARVLLAINPAGTGYLGVVQNNNPGGSVFVEAIDTRGAVDPAATLSPQYNANTGLPNLSLAVNATGQAAASWGTWNSTNSSYDVHLRVLR